MHMTKSESHTKVWDLLSLQGKVAEISLLHSKHLFIFLFSNVYCDERTAFLSYTDTQLVSNDRNYTHLEIKY